MILPARSRPARRDTQSQKAAGVQLATLQPPTMGLVTNASLANGGGAVVLENFWPSPTGIEPRGGCASFCNVPTGVKSLFEHGASGKFFAATETAIYEFTDASTGALSSSVAGQTNGEWSTYEFRNSGGSFLICVNGVDDMQRFDGTTWLTINAASTPAITGVGTDLLTHVWAHRSRLFFIQRQSLSAWYLATNSIAGAATELPLTGVFRKGGGLIFGGTWSSDSGAGMDDRCVFVTDAGEVAVYAGSDPSTPANWSLQGVYDVGVPLGRKAVLNIGGDLIIATREGLIPMSGVVQKDPTQLSLVSLARNVAPDWRGAVIDVPGGWRVTKWPSGNMLVACPLGDTFDTPPLYVANLENGAWATVTGWKIGDIQALGSGLYYGSRNGKIYRAWTGGLDDGLAFTCRAALAHDHLGNPAGHKAASAVQAVWRVRGSIDYSVALAQDYATTFGPPPPVSTPPDDGTSSLWDVSDWDVTEWGISSLPYTIRSGWYSVGRFGFAFSAQVQLVSSTTARVVAQLQRIDIAYQVGGAVA